MKNLESKESKDIVDYLPSEIAICESYKEAESFRDQLIKADNGAKVEILGSGDNSPISMPKMLKIVIM